MVWRPTDRSLITHHESEGFHDSYHQLERRVGVVEKEVKEIRKDLSGSQQGQMKVPNALRETQVEHGKTLEQHSTALAELRKTQLEQSVTLGAHTQILDGHSKALAELRKTQREHSATLGAHTEILGQHTETLNELVGGQRLIMRHLGVVVRHLGIADQIDN